MEETPVPPPPAYAAYPRANAGSMYGTSEKLTRLYRGYHGMSYCFLFMFLAFIPFFAGVGLASSPGNEVWGILCFIVAATSYIGAFYMSIRSGGDIGFGIGWPPAVGIMLGILTPLVGIIMAIVLQYVAVGEMKNYGIKNRAFKGLSKVEVRSKIEELATMEGSLQPVFTPS